jgi:GTP-binding protein
MKLPVVAVVGRPNVGKSTLFNRIVGRRLAIVDDQPGVTRDRNFAQADWAGHHFFVVDTGGVVEEDGRPLDREVREQALVAIEEADVLVLVVDGKEGLHPLDGRISTILRRQDKPVVVAVNKEDRLPQVTGVHEFWELGLGEPVPVSANSGRGSGDLLDAIVAHLPEAEPVEADPSVIRVAVIGKPNVGKSSFVNRLLGTDRMVVSDIAGTTRDPVDTPFAYHGHTLIFVDTAGLRRQSKVKDNLEYYSYIRTERVVREADVARAVGAPVEATIGVDPAVARAVDAGLLSCRARRLFGRLEHVAAA